MSTTSPPEHPQGFAHRPVTLHELWTAIPKAWILMGVVAGVTAKLVYGVIWYKNTIVERPEFEAKIAEVRRDFSARMDQDRAATERMIANVSDKIVAHSDSNHADMDVKWSAANSKLDMLTSQMSSTQNMMQQLLLRSAKK